MSERTVREILVAWRDLEREQAHTDPRSDRWKRLELEIARLRAEYHRVLAQHRVLGRKVDGSYAAVTMAASRSDPPQL